MSDPPGVWDVWEVQTAQGRHYSRMREENRDLRDTLAAVRPYLHHLVNCDALLPPFDGTTFKYNQTRPCNCGLVDLVAILDRSDSDE